MQYCGLPHAAHKTHIHNSCITKHSHFPSTSIYNSTPHNTENTISITSPTQTYKILEKLSCMNGNIVIVGDFNIDWLNSNGSEHKRFCNILETLGFVQNALKHTKAIICLTIVLQEMIVTFDQITPSRTSSQSIGYFMLLCNVYPPPLQFENR